MNNGEYLETLTNEEKAVELQAVFNCFYLQAMATSYYTSYQYLTGWLDAPHQKSADEDFSEIRWHKEFEDKDEVRYGMWIGEAKFILIITPTGLMYTVRGNGGYFDHEINQIRTIASKKRKEMGWK